MGMGNGDTVVISVWIDKGFGVYSISVPEEFRLYMLHQGQKALSSGEAT